MRSLAVAFKTSVCLIRLGVGPNGEICQGSLNRYSCVHTIIVNALGVVVLSLAVWTLASGPCIQYMYVYVHVVASADAPVICTMYTYNTGTLGI